MCHDCQRYKGDFVPVSYEIVSESEKDIRLDRWFKRHYPDLPHVLLEKLIRKKNIRLNGKKTTANARLQPKDNIRIPPLDISPKTPTAPKQFSKADIALVKGMVLYKDDDMIVLNKPAGLAVQGGTKTTHHLDALLDILRFEKEEKPRLVHRLDKETSGILVVARTAQSATKLTRLFKTKEIRKTYWALVQGCPNPKKGKIEAPLLQKKCSDKKDKRVIDEDGKPAISLYQVQDHLGDKVSWLQMSPLTGRTHQLRIHAADVLKTPILGDDRYGTRTELTKKLPSKMFLHARAISIPVSNKKDFIVEAPLPIHFKQAFQEFGFSEQNVSPLFLLRSPK